MTKTVSTIRAELAALQAELKAAEETENAEAKAQAAEFKFAYDWQIDWPHPAQFRVSRTATAATLERVERFRAQFPTYPYPPEPFEGGMTYSVLIGNDGNNYVEGGGGSVVVQFSDERRSSFDPELIPADILAELREGRIPDTIKRP